jgi:hypothetical protein
MAAFARLPLGRHAIGGIRSVVKNHSVASATRKRAPLRRRLSLLERTTTSSPAQLRSRRLLSMTPSTARVVGLLARRPSVERTSPVCSPELAAMSYRLRSRAPAAGGISASPVSVRKLP